MKITYEFNISPDEEADDEHDLKLFQIASDMYDALFELSNYRRRLEKEYDPFDFDAVWDRLGDILTDSKIHEIL